MESREASIPPEAATRIPEAIDRLIELYMALEKPEEVSRWRALLARASRSVTGDDIEFPADPFPR